MPRLLQPFPRNPLAFPAGVKPGFDPSHPASIRLNVRTGVSLVPVGGNFVNLLNGKLGTVAGTITGNIFAVGPVVKNVTSFSFVTFSGLGTSLTALTMAAIVQFSSLGAFQGVGSDNTVTPNDFGIDTTANVMLFTNIEVSSGFVLSVNVPYFIAGSLLGGSKANFVVMNLLTGQLRSTSIATAGTVGASDGVFCALNNHGSTGNQHMRGVCAALYYYQGFLSLQTMQAWAADPWSFWYPPPAYNLVGVTAAPPTSQFISFTQVAAHVTRRIESIGY